MLVISNFLSVSASSRFVYPKSVLFKLAEEFAVHKFLSPRFPCEYSYHILKGDFHKPAHSELCDCILFQSVIGA